MMNIDMTKLNVKVSNNFEVMNLRNTITDYGTLSHVHTNEISLSALRISEPILQSMLFEVCTYPKPGLVTPISNGAHHDMSIHSFIMSSVAISPCFSLCAQLGINHHGKLTQLFDNIRSVGAEYENRLFAVTNGINTQKGILFLASILATATGYLTGQNAPFTVDNISQTVSAMCQGLCEKDFQSLKYRQPRTAGEYLYLNYGIKGIRGEAQSGFTTVINIGLPALCNAFNHGLSLRESFIHTLIAIMTSCEDTTVLARSNIEMLNQLKLRATEIMAMGGMMNHLGMPKVEKLDEWCCARNISPGGAADLLSLTISLYLLTYHCFPKGIS